MFHDTSFKKACRALFNFASISKLWPLLVEGNVHIKNIKVKKGVEKNPTHIWKIADTLFEGDV